MAVSEESIERFTEWLRRIVAEQLRIPADTVDVEMPLMALGIDSLAGMGIVADVALALGHDLPAEVLWEHDSIGKLARHLDAAGLLGRSAGLPLVSPLKSSPLDGGSRHPLAVTLQPHGDGTPVFVMPVAMGTPATAADLGMRLGRSQPVFGMRLPPEPMESIESISASLIDGIKSVRRKGPYRLLGYCYGGVLAFEVARQLLAGGDVIEQLVLLDAPFPFTKPAWRRLDARERLMVVWTSLWRSLETAPWRARALIGALSRGEPGVFRRVRAALGEAFLWMVAVLSPREGAAAVAPEAEYVHASTFEKHNIALLETYWPRQAEVRVLYVQSEWYRRKHVYAERRWPTVAGGGMRIVGFGCGHTGLASSHLDEVAALIQSDASG